MRLLKRYEKVLKYILYSLFSTTVDFTTVAILYYLLNVNLVLSNTVGVIIGFAISYVLSSKSVFDTKLGISGFTVFFGTFIFGLIFSDALISVSNSILINYFDENIFFINFC